MEKQIYACNHQCSAQALSAETELGASIKNPDFCVLYVFCKSTSGFPRSSILHRFDSFAANLKEIFVIELPLNNVMPQTKSIHSYMALFPLT